MKGFDVLKVKSAVKTRNEFDLSRTHLTTMDFGQIVPMFCEETIPGDSFSIDSEFFSRMAPLVKPTYGKFQFKTVAGFVPYHQIAYDSDAWLAGKTAWEGTTPRHRFITNDDLFGFVNDSLVSTGTGATSNNCDFAYVDSNGTTQYKVFTNEGRYYVKVLNALGYSIPQGVDYRSGSAWNTSLKGIHLSAYPILGFFKLYNDYMSQSQRFNGSTVTNLLRNIKYDNTVGGSYSAGNLYYGGLKTLFQGLKLNYENDYFTSAWQNPNQALAGAPDTINSAGVPDISTSLTYPSTVSRTASDNILQTPLDTQTAVIGQRALDFLKSFDDWVRRNNYSGSRAVQQIYSRFGIKTDDYKSHYAQVITTDTLPIQVGDVTSTADTAAAGGTELGSYSGKGIMNGGKSVSIQVSDYGIIIILGYYTVAPMNSFGSDRRVLRSTPLDYYNPEFDGLGCDAIPVGEFWSSPIVVGDTVQDNNVYGFTERYNSYRYGRDVITGEFRNYHPTADMNTWHSGRNLAAVRTAGTLVAQSTSVNTLPQTDSEYNRIFSVTSGNVDHFYMTARFKVKAVRPMLNLNQVPRLGEGDTTVPRNGNVIS